jgi:hypothetical protein
MKTMPQIRPWSSLRELPVARVPALVPRDNVVLNLANVALRLLIAPRHNVRWLIAMAAVMAGMCILYANNHITLLIIY